MSGMVAVALDTHRVVKRLRDAGFSDAQAETVTEVLTEATHASLADVATNARVDSLEQRMDARFESLEQRMNARFENLEQRMTIKLGSMLVAGVALVAVLVKLL